MIRAWCVFACLLVLAAPAMAQTVQIRSGEHEGFSRLVLDMPKRIPWRLAQTEAGADLVFEKADLILDTSAVFNRIPRHRLSEVSWHGPRRALSLSVACNCEVKGFWHGPSMLVLDINERPREKEPALETAIQEADIRPAVEPDEPISLQRPAPSRAAAMAASGIFGDAANNSPAATAAIRPTEMSPFSVSREAQDRLLQQFSRAASQGLLSPKITLPISSSRDQGVSKENPSPNERTSQPMQAIPSFDTSQINLKAQSSIDRDFLGSMLGQAQNLTASGCLANGLVDVASWGTTANFGNQISALRLRLTGEFDEADPEVVVKLAKLYLFFGFGAEAMQSLTLLSDPTQESVVLYHLAAIAEHDHTSYDSPLAGQMDCDAPAALWSSLSYEVLPRDLPVDPEAVLRAFNALPQHLRVHYGPILARRFLKAGNIELAAKLLRILDRTGEPSTPEAAMAHAQVDLVAGKTEEAEAKLKSVAQSNAEPSAEALIQMIENRVDRGEVISFELAQLAGAYAYELQGDTLSPALRAAHIRALAASGAFDSAFEALPEAQSGLQDSERVELRADVLELLVHRADDMTFLHHALADAGNGLSSLPPQIGNKVAQRFLNLGFVVQASAFAAPQMQGKTIAAQTRQLLRAEIALRSDRPRQAIVELLELTGEAANLLRARARSAVGEHAAASQLYASGKQDDHARLEAWLAGDWKRASAPDDTVYENLAVLMSTPEMQTESEAPQAILARDRAMVVSSRSARHTLAALLEANPAPESLEGRP